MIKLVILDIDGVLTDGTIQIDAQGHEHKTIHIKDIDAIFALKNQGFRLAAVTGEQTEIVGYFENRFPWDWFFQGKKNKLETVRVLLKEQGLTMEEVAYIGDGKYDVPLLSEAGLSFCPADAIEEAKQQADFVLRNPGGMGCVWEMASILETYTAQKREETYVYQRIREHQSVFHSMASDVSGIREIMAAGKNMVNRLKQGAQIFLCGNGGSAADAQHIAAEFIGRFYKERPAINAEALTVNTSILTALGNDYGYDIIFSRQLEGKAHSGDILIGLSTSGTSKNIWKALEYGRQQGLFTVMMTGDVHIKALEEVCDFVLRVPSKVTPRIQEGHIFIGHILAEYIEQTLF